VGRWEEKPDQGSTLASIFKHKKQSGFIEIFPNEIFTKGAYVTWAIGHLCQLVSPEKYEPSWKKWSLDNLPMIPEQFEYEVTKDKASQFALIKKLILDPMVSEIIHAGDAGREGELIIRNILRLTKCRKPMRRLWISSLTANATAAVLVFSSEYFTNSLTKSSFRVTVVLMITSITFFIIYFVIKFITSQGKNRERHESKLITICLSRSRNMIEK